MLRVQNAPGQSSPPRRCHRSFVWTISISGPGWVHLLEHLCRSKQIVVVMILQSQLHKVHGRSASGDLTMRPLSSTVEEFGNEGSPARSKTCGDTATFHHNSLCVAQAAGDQSTSTSVNTKWDNIRATGRFFLCCYHIVKFFLVNRPLKIFRGILYNLENAVS